MALALGLGLSAAPLPFAVTTAPAFADTIAPAEMPEWGKRSIRERSLQSKPFQQLQTMMCKTGFILQIWPDGTVNGTRNRKSEYGILQLMTATTMLTLINSIPKINIRGAESKMWLCMNATGVLYGSATKTKECDFYQKPLETFWNVYYSTIYPTGETNRHWYVGLDRDTGQTKKITKQTKKTVQFLPVSISKETEKKEVNIISPTKTLKSNPRTRPKKSHLGHRHTIRHRKKNYSKTLKPRHRSRPPKKRKKKNKVGKISRLLDSIESALKDSANSPATDWTKTYSQTDIFYRQLNELKSESESIRHPERKRSSLLRRLAPSPSNPQRRRLKHS